MSRLANDCFAYGGDRIAVRAAHALLRERIAPVVGVEEAPLADASGRCLAAPLVSPRDVPAFDNAAVDGFAFAFQPGMREAGARLTLLPGRAAAGHPFSGALPAGAALARADRCGDAGGCRHRGAAGGGRAPRAVP